MATFIAAGLKNLVNIDEIGLISCNGDGEVYLYSHGTKITLDPEDGISFLKQLSRTGGGAIKPIAENMLMHLTASVAKY